MCAPRDPSSQTAADHPDCRLGSVFDRNLLQEILHVLLDRFVTDFQRVGNNGFAVGRQEGREYLRTGKEVPRREAGLGPIVNTSASDVGAS